MRERERVQSELKNQRERERSEEKKPGKGDIKKKNHTHLEQPSIDDGDELRYSRVARSTSWTDRPLQL